MRNLKTFILLLTIGCTSFINAQTTVESNIETIQWKTWEEVQTSMKNNPKPFLVDVYTSWCGWCKKMDKTTLVDQSIVQYINENMYAIKFDAEYKTPIVFDNVKYENLELERKHGSHQLANAILNNIMNYPTIVYFNENYERITISPEFKDVPTLKKELEFIVSKAYLTSSL